MYQPSSSSSLLAESEIWLVPLPLAGLSRKPWRRAKKGEDYDSVTFYNTESNHGEGKVQKGDHGQRCRWKGRWSFPKASEPCLGKNLNEIQTGTRVVWSIKQSITGLEPRTVQLQYVHFRCSSHLDNLGSRRMEGEESEWAKTN